MLQQVQARTYIFDCNYHDFAILQNKSECLEPLHDKLKEVLSYYHSDKYHLSAHLCCSASVISCEEQAGLIWKENQTGFIAHQLSHETTLIISFDKVRLILGFNFSF